MSLVRRKDCCCRHSTPYIQHDRLSSTADCSTALRADYDTLATYMSFHLLDLVNDDGSWTVILSSRLSLDCLVSGGANIAVSEAKLAFTESFSTGSQAEHGFGLLSSFERCGRML